MLQLGVSHVCDGVALGLGGEGGHHSTNLVGEDVDCIELSLLIVILHSDEEVDDYIQSSASSKCSTYCEDDVDRKKSSACS